MICTGNGIPLSFGESNLKSNSFMKRQSKIFACTIFRFTSTCQSFLVATLDIQVLTGSLWTYSTSI